MKTLILISALLFNVSAFACSCSISGFPLSAQGPVQEYIENNYRVYDFKATDENMIWMAYYPTLLERIEAIEMRGSSCEGSGPNGEPMVYCADSRKSDYKIILKNCEVILQVKTTRNSVKIKNLNSTCERG